VTRDLWNQLVVSPSGEEANWQGDVALVELFHENSKLTRFDPGVPAREVARSMQDMWESLSYEAYPAVELPPRAPIDLTLDEIIRSRHSTSSMIPATMTLPQVTTILEHSYGVTRDNEGTAFPRPFRTVPSAGALYPLEIYVHTVAVDGLAAGLYHYNPSRGALRHLREGDLSDELAASIGQPDIAYGASMMMFITAAFERCTFKYGARGYRFALLEAGHVAQNMNLAATGLGFGSLNIGGFYDRDVEAILGIDGVTHSVLYLVAVGDELKDDIDAEAE
jgi:SagB-type dehydrogenase family enzyme